MADTFYLSGSLEEAQKSGEPVPMPPLIGVRERRSASLSSSGDVPVLRLSSASWQLATSSDHKLNTFRPHSSQVTTLAPATATWCILPL